MKRISNVKRLSGIFVMLTAITLIGTGSLQSAYAEPDIGIGADLSVIVFDSTTDIRVAAGSLPTKGTNVRVFDTNPSNLLGSADNNVCPTGTAADTTFGSFGVGVWELRALDGTTPIRYYINAFNQDVRAPFGTPIGGGTITVTASNGALVTADGSDPQTNGVASVQAKWVNIPDSDGSTPNTTRVGNYALMTCGIEGGNNQQTETIGSFATTLPVGGSIIPVNTVSLVIAGMGSLAWITPVIGGAGAGIAFLINSKRKSN